MSTTFEVFPQSASLPSIQQLLELSSKRLHEALLTFNIDAEILIDVQIHTSNKPWLPIRPDKYRRLDLNAPLEWKYGEYAWFIIPGVAGGTDAYFRDWETFYKQGLREEMETNPTMNKMKEKMEACLHNDHYWFFRRSAGQPAIINLGYGIIAAALAELTEGLIYSSDNAWDYEKLPANPLEFYTWYFHAEGTKDLARRDWMSNAHEFLVADVKEHQLALANKS